MLSLFSTTPKEVLPVESKSQEFISNVKEQGTVFFKNVGESTETQKKLVACARTVADVSMISFGPYAAWSAMLGAGLGVYSPKASKDLCRLIDGAIEGSCKDLKFEVKLALVGTVAVAAYLWLPVISSVATVYSMKIGAEMSVRYLGPQKKSQ